MIVRQDKEKIRLPAGYCLRSGPHQEFAATDVCHAQNDIAESVERLQDELNDSPRGALIRVPKPARSST